MKQNYLAVCMICTVIHVSLMKTSEGRQQQHEEHLEEYYKIQTNLDEYEDFVEEDVEDCREDKQLPVILWWTPFTGVLGLSRYCTLGNCCLTQDRSLIHQPNVKVLLFYGTDFDPTDLPLPRKKDIWWGLLHEESPKNRPILNHPPVVGLFNITGTFKWESDFPLSLQFLPSLDSLTSKEEFVPTKKKNEFLESYLGSEKSDELQNVNSKERVFTAEKKESVNGNNAQFPKGSASTKNKGPVDDKIEKSFGKIAPLVYIHSDCDTPSERDKYMMELSRYIKVDSLGDCLNSKTLPPHIADASHFNHPDFWRILARYKFTLSMENYGCDDYITEKFWRPLMVGSVPVYWGSQSITDWAPNERSVIKISDFASPKDLADYLHLLLRDDSLYEAHLTHKTRGEITNLKLIAAMNERQWGLDDLERGSFIDHYECFVCDEIYRSHPHLTSRTSYETKIADTRHYGCPEPKTVLTDNINEKSYWLEEYEKSKTEAEVLSNLLKYNKPFSEDEFYTRVFKGLRTKGFFRRFPPKHDEF
ncbi:alpha-(1,3)-fucosyltransferase 10-like [Scylla paramamosain]|uniref:alpha-(1,3)-fucosyltransferase 10-like n=1 Tax=Scylla paramamosain TaxID=85552 RepID=UPI0030838339